MNSLKSIILKYPKTFGVIAASICVLIIVVVVVLIDKNGKSENFNIPSFVSENLVGECSDCQFLNGMKDYENMNCTPTLLQLDVVKNMDAARIKYCGDNTCIPEMEELLISCFTSLNGTCSDCNFTTLINQPCMVNSYSEITDPYDNDKTILQKRLYVSKNCECTPSKDQIDLFNNLVVNNLKDETGNYLLNCQNKGCYPEMDNIANNCLNYKFGVCDDCDFLSKMYTSCVDVDLGVNTNSMDDITRKTNFANSCRCVPTQSQLDILDDLKNNNIDYKTCVQPPFCSQLKTLTDLCIPSGTLPPPVSTELNSEPDGFIYPNDCEDCDFIDFMKNGNVSNGLVAATESNGIPKYYVTLSCGCTPTNDQMGVVQNILDSQNGLESCAENNCSELTPMSSQCI